MSGFSHVAFPSADEGVQEKEKPLEKLEVNSSPGKGEDKEVKPGEAQGGFGARSGVKALQSAAGAWRRGEGACPLGPRWRGRPWHPPQLVLAIWWCLGATSGNKTPLRWALPVRAAQTVGPAGRGRWSAAVEQGAGWWLSQQWL